MAKKHHILNMVSPLSSTDNNDHLPSLSLSPTTEQQQQQQALPLIVHPQPSPLPTKPMEKFSEDYCEVCSKEFI